MRDLIILLITIVTFGITIGKLIWEMSKLSTQVVENKRDIDGLGSKLHNIVDKSDAKLDEITKQLAEIGRQVAVINTHMEYIAPEVQKRLKEE